MTNPDSGIVIIATLTATPENRDHLLQALQELLPAARAENGVYTFLLHENVSQPGQFTLYEHFHDQTAIDTLAKRSSGVRKTSGVDIKSSISEQGHDEKGACALSVRHPSATMDAPARARSTPRRPDRPRRPSRPGHHIVPSSLESLDDCLGDGVGCVLLDEVVGLWEADDDIVGEGIVESAQCRGEWESRILHAPDEQRGFGTELAGYLAGQPLKKGAGCSDLFGKLRDAAT
jgi:quinol monooxygenase YgiN